MNLAKMTILNPWSVTGFLVVATACAVSWRWPDINEALPTIAYILCGLVLAQTGAIIAAENLDESNFRAWFGSVTYAMFLCAACLVQSLL